ncbi:MULTISPECIES: DUF2871 domain-containing protein [unclassified Romboutsia]|uniref:DUF2871 domain-containing protein n=1 Tax=unclassified Romboutsia TaxID=2626894 RepID=UPI000821BE6C|nr:MULTISPECIES: DUF2871 domain-containing protein [unclassified Romboutsia]SCH84451.1 Protein of uncharacterised function (DUF2871) [uncultured Clostridium sp.]
MQKYFKISTFYLILGLALGVFYREYTKINNFTGITTLSTTHTHVLMLGFIFFIIVLLLEKNFNISSIKSFKSWLITYNIGFIYFIATLVFRGILQVNNSDFAMFNHISGLGHTILGVSLCWFSVIVNKALKH